jgi:hypothetical protein
MNSVVQAAEKKNVSGSIKNKQMISNVVSTPGDDPKHVIIQSVIADIITSSDPDWNDVEAMAYEQSDRVAGSGSRKGYLVVRHKNGDESYLKYEGNDKMTADDRGAWEVSSEGDIHVIGGTGKFKDMKGNGKYKGKTNPKGSSVNWEATMEY